jgi:hypothetical protein
MDTTTPQARTTSPTPQAETIVSDMWCVPATDTTTSPSPFPKKSLALIEYYYNRSKMFRDGTTLPIGTGSSCRWAGEPGCMGAVAATMGRTNGKSCLGSTARGKVCSLSRSAFDRKITMGDRYGIEGGVPLPTPYRLPWERFCLGFFHLKKFQTRPCLKKTYPDNLSTRQRDVLAFLAFLWYACRAWEKTGDYDRKGIEMDTDEIEIEIVLDNVELEELMEESPLADDPINDDDDEEEDFMSLYDDPYSLLFFEED